MDRAALMIMVIFVGSIVVLILTSDNEPTPYVREDERNDSHYVDTIPGHRSTHNVTIITNPYIDFDK